MTSRNRHEKRSVGASDSGSFLSRLGPGLITGAADDDPSGIATYSQAGAKFGNDTLWTIALTLPLMIGVQIICARVGSVSRKGLAANLVAIYPKPLIVAAVCLLLFANLFNIAADLNAMGAAAVLIVGGKMLIYVVVLGICSLLLQLYAPYALTVRILKWLTLALFAYVAAMFTLNISWKSVLAATIRPPLHFQKDYLSMIVAIFGTTISPYMFFWQASHEVERSHANGRTKRVRFWAQALAQFRRINLDTWVGMIMSNLVAFCIMVTTSIVIHEHGNRDLSTTAQAAEALKPVAGNFAFLLFSLGILGTGLLALPVLAGSAAFAVADTFGWSASLDKKPWQARAFYVIVCIAMIGGIVLCLFGMDPIHTLFLSAVINGVIAVPIMVLLMLASARREVMGKFQAGPLLHGVGWAATFVMAAAVVAMFATLA